MSASVVSAEGTKRVQEFSVHPKRLDTWTEGWTSSIGLKVAIRVRRPPPRLRALVSRPFRRLDVDTARRDVWIDEARLWICHR